MKKKNMKLRKYKIIGNKDATPNSWFTRKVIEMSTINEYQKQGYHILRKQFKIIG